MRSRDLLGSFFSLSKLFAQMSILLINYPISKRRARKSFEKELVRSGLSRNEAEELGNMYQASFSIKEIVQVLSNMRRNE